MGMSQFSTV
jgi:hypothetical protein